MTGVHPSLVERHFPMKRYTLPVTAVLLAFTIAAAGWAQSNWEGPTGAYLNPLAWNLPAWQGQGALHYLDLQPAGSLTTYGASYGLTDRLEAGLTQASLSIGGSSKTNILHAKYILRPLGGGKPGVAVGAVLRDISGGASTSDYYLVATHIFPAKTPVIASVTVRSTNGLGSGLFGKTGRTTEFGGFLGVQVRPNLIPNMEFLGQPDGPDWKDIGVRWIANPTTYWDFGIADVANGLDDQLALGVTHQF